MFGYGFYKDEFKRGFWRSSRGAGFVGGVRVKRDDG